MRKNSISQKMSRGVKTTSSSINNLHYVPPAKTKFHARIIKITKTIEATY